MCKEEARTTLQNGLVYLTRATQSTIYLDFRKAFDTVPYQRLLKKLESYGIRGKLLKWITQFIVGRKQQVVIDGIKSQDTEVKSGISQGSVLDPLLFVIYINDLPAGISSSCMLFADDAKIYGGVQNVEHIEIIQEDLVKIDEWAQKWQMGLNTAKCKSLYMGRNNPHHNYTMNGNLLSQSSEEKDLGVVIDKDLKFHTHTAQAVSKAFQILTVINKSFANLDELMLPWNPMFLNTLITALFLQLHVILLYFDVLCEQK
jgi:ribonuclease P/MRP protein subunit RPP40